MLLKDLHCCWHSNHSWPKEKLPQSSCTDINIILKKIWNIINFLYFTYVFLNDNKRLLILIKRGYPRSIIYLVSHIFIMSYNNNQKRPYHRRKIKFSKRKKHDMHHMFQSTIPSVEKFIRNSIFKRLNMCWANIITSIVTQLILENQMTTIQCMIRKSKSH
jgi:hypothetical protein